MPTKKDDEKKPAAKKTVSKKPVKKAAPQKTPAKKPVVKKDISKKELVSKGQQRKLKIEEKFSGKYYLGVGKRKSAIALVRLYEKGKGKIFVNNAEFEKYFFGTLIESALAPLALSGKLKDFDITVKVEGGGISSQSDAVCHGISRALVEYDADLRPILKKAGLLTRDSRVKERKKPGLKRARRAPQWAKR